MAKAFSHLVWGSFVALASGCILSPTDDGIVTRTDAPLAFSGYHPEANAPVQVKAWNFTEDRMVNLGAAVRTASSPAPAAWFDDPIFAWSATRTLAPSFWRAGPRGGQCAVVAADTTLGGANRAMLTVEPDWSECYADHRSQGSFATHCASDNSPRAALFTNDFRPVELTASSLRTAGALASLGVRITLDNYTSTAFEFCRPDNPAGCPDVPSPTPNTYKFYRPNGATVTAEGSTLAFSIAPSRSDPMTVYLDDMGSRTIDFRLVGESLVMGIDFESVGPEIRMNCIDNFACAFVDGRTIELGTPRAELTFQLAVRDGRLGYDDVSVAFTATGSAEATQAAESIGAAMAETLAGSPDVKAAVGSALDQLLRRAGGLDDAFPIRRLSFAASSLSLHAGCPTD